MLHHYYGVELCRFINSWSQQGHPLYHAKFKSLPAHSVQMQRYRPPLAEAREEHMRRLEGRRAIITGAGTGIGRASALRFASEGAHVLAVGRTEETLRETVSLVRDAGGVADF